MSTDDPIGSDRQGRPVTLKDIWPADAEIHEIMDRVLVPDMYRKRYADVFRGPEEWRRIETPESMTYDWDPASTYVKNPQFFEGMAREPAGLSDIKGARLLAILGDNVTTDHISPAGSIMKDSPAGAYLTGLAVTRADFNSYGARRGNHEVLMRGTFANIRIRNEMLPGVEGGFTRYAPDGERMTIYDAAMKYRAAGVPLVVVGGKSYGMGSSRDWAAKGPLLLGVKAVIVEDFERIHRSNLIGMGVVPLQFMSGTDRKTLGLDGTESFDITGIAGGISPRMEVTMTVHRADGRTETVPLVCCIDTEDEVEYFRHGGILHYVLRRLAEPAG